MKVICALALSLLIATAAQAASGSDLRDYALSSCLIKQSASRDLQTEGYRLGDIVINRAGIDPFVWKPLERAVARAFTRRGMMMVHVDAPVAQSTRPAPLASCLRVIDDPAVRSVMAKLQKGKTH